MNCKGTAVAFVALILGPSPVQGAQTTKPDFSGVWVLDRAKSDLKSPPLSADQPHSGGGGGGGGGTGGARSGGGRGMGSGSGGGRRGGGGGHGSGGSTARGAPSSSPLKIDLDTYQIGEVADKLTIQHVDPAITIKPAEKTGNSEPTDQAVELTYTADGKTHQKYMADGWVKSKTSWDGQQLVTKAKENSTLGSMEVDEVRSLSADGNMLTIKLTFKGSSSHWTENAVYLRENPETNHVETKK
jgi:hypothetical protein